MHKYWKQFLNIIEDTKEQDFLWLKMVKIKGKLFIVARSDMSDKELKEVLPRMQDYIISNADDIRQFQKEWNNKETF